jgi:peptidoglycan/LPS O-acetylase OafA/YrhL
LFGLGQTKHFGKSGGSSLEGVRIVKFRSDIEGLRAIAVIPVVLYHANNRWAPGGYIGVDVFFVISGFLISKIILDEVMADTFSFWSFYRRRIGRIFPALFLVLSVTSLAALVVLSPAALTEFGITLRSTALFFSNIEFNRLSGYFGGDAELKPLLHTWSLAVEEQFYIFFPVLLLGTKRWFRGQYLIVIVVCFLISLLLSVLLVARHPQAAFYLGPPRAFELLVGAFIALDALPKNLSPIARDFIAGLGIAMIAFSAFMFNQATTFPGVNALVPSLGAAAIIYAGRSGQSTVGKCLSLPALRFIGAISYSLYLWHWPVLVVARNYLLADLTPIQSACCVLCALGLSIVSWRFVEQPFRARANSDKPVFFVAGTAMAAALAFAASIAFTNGFPGRFSTEALRLFGYGDDFNHRRPQCHGGPDNNIAYADNCLFGPSGNRHVVAVWGDSFGAELAVALEDVIGTGFSTMEVTSSACPPALDFNTKERPKCAAHNSDAMVGLTHDDRVDVVILVAKYRHYVELGLWAPFERGFEETISTLVASGKRVIVIYPLPVYPRPVPDTLGMMVARGQQPESYRLPASKYREANGAAIAELNLLTEKYRLQRVLTEDLFCSPSACTPYEGGVVLYWDDTHLSVSGAKKLAAAIKPLL